MGSKRWLGVCATALALAAPVAFAQQEDPALQQILVAAYSLRRRGKFRAAATAFEELLRKVKNKDAKRILARETADLFTVMGRTDKAVTLYRRNNDIPREIEALLSLGTQKSYKDALTISRYVKYPRGEALALARLGQSKEALKLMEANGLQRERADLLLQLGKFEQAAKAFEDVQDFFSQARALKHGGLLRQSERAYEDAVEQLRFTLRDPSGSLQRVRRVKVKLEEAKDGVTRERARLVLAKAYGQLAQDYRRLAEAYSNSGRKDYASKSGKLAANALKFYTKQKELLEDSSGGGDAFGAAWARSVSLDATLAEVQAEITRYGD